MGRSTERSEGVRTDVYYKRNQVSMGSRTGGREEGRGSGNQSGAFGLGRTATGSRREPAGAAGSRREAGDPPGAEHTGLKRLKEHEITK